MKCSGREGLGLLLSRIAGTSAVLALAAGLSGCMDTSSRFAATSSAAPAKGAARPGISPRGAPLAIASLEGAPTTLAQRFGDKIRSAAAARDVVVTDAGNAKYLARGYLSATRAADGADVSYVWDIFDSRRQRIQRVEDAIALKGSVADPWSLVDDKALSDLAALSAEDLAAVLTNTPEAASATGATGAVAAAVGRNEQLPASASAFR